MSGGCDSVDHWLPADVAIVKADSGLTWLKNDMEPWAPYHLLYVTGVTVLACTHALVLSLFSDLQIFRIKD